LKKIKDADKCHPGREIITTVKEQQVTITKRDDKFICFAAGIQLDVCDLPDEVKKEGMTCLVDGEVLKPFPGEKRKGSAFRLQKIYYKKKITN